MSSKVSNEIPIDWEKGVATCGGDEAMFRMMIEKFEGLSFDATMGSLFDSIMEMDHKQVKFFAHTLLGPLRYIAAEKCINLATDIDKAAVACDTNTILTKYVQFLDAARVLKTYIASEANKRPNLAEIDRYEREVRAKYFPAVIDSDPPGGRPPGCCGDGCNMF